MDNEPIYSATIRSGKTTFFVDVKESKNGNKYLMITESRIKDGESERTSLRIFGETVAEFQKAIAEAAEAFSQSE